jgi:Holliday junction resolvase-like predicted endonuclease
MLPMGQTSEIGKIGEDRATSYLIEKGYTVIVRNFRKTFGEIDIVASPPDATLVFIEVKTLVNKYGNSRNIFLPEDNFTTQKLNKVKRICQFFIASHPHLIHERQGWRMDLIAIELFQQDDSFLIRHYENL